MSLFFLERLALMLHQGHRRAFSQTEAGMIWSSGFSQHYPEVDTADLLWELHSSNSLIFPDGNGYSLGHLSYQEFLAASAIVAGQRLDLLREKFYDPYWRQVVFFYAGITGDVERLFHQVHESKPLIEGDRFLEEIVHEARYTPGDVRSFVNDIIEEEDFYDEQGDDTDDDL